MSKKSVTQAERNRMIAEAAYYRSLGRRPGVGDPVEDWLAAELEIDARFDLVHHDPLELREFYEHLAEEACCSGSDEALARLRSEVASDADWEDTIESRSLARHDNEFEALAARLMDADARIAGLGAVPSTELPEARERLEALKRLRDSFAHELDKARDHAGGARAAAKSRARTLSEQIFAILGTAPRPHSGA